MVARAFASASVQFGLVSIPVKLYSGSSSESGERLEFHTVHTVCGARVKQVNRCPACDVRVEGDETSKGYEHAKGEYVLLASDEYKALLESTGNNLIELAEFIPRNAIDPLYYEKTYYLGPDKGGARAYRLLVYALAKAKRLALARYAARGKQHLVVLRPELDRLVMHQLFFSDQVKPIDEVPLTDTVPPKAAELRLAVQFIEQSAQETFRPENYPDEVKARLRELIQRKVRGEEIVVAPDIAPEGKTVDLLEALKATLALSSPPAARARTTKSQARAKK